MCAFTGLSQRYPPLPPTLAAPHPRAGKMASRGAAGLGSLLARGRSAVLPRRGGGPPGGFFGEGTKEKSHGLLFGETPPPPGQSRKWESWEAPW